MPDRQFLINDNPKNSDIQNVHTRPSEKGQDPILHATGYSIDRMVIEK